MVASVLIKQLQMFIFCLVIILHQGNGQTVGGKLRKHLFHEYNKYERPVLNTSKPIDVTFGFQISQILEVNDRDQTVKMKTWVIQSWKNEFLTWEPSEWSNMTYIMVDAKEVWFPDIVHHNNANKDFPGGAELYKTNIQLSNDGTCEWKSPATFTSMCTLNIAFFPFDEHQCNAKFSSWAYDSRSIMLVKPTSQTLIPIHYYNSSQWRLPGGFIEIVLTKYECCTYPYSETYIYFTLQRKPLYYVFNVITPCLVLVVNIFIGFFLPPDCGERVGLTMTILLAVAVFLQSVSDTLPRNSDSIPVLGVFYILIMCETTFSLVTTCIVLVVHHRGNDQKTKQIPYWMKVIFIDAIGKCLNVKRDNGKDSCIKFNINIDEDLSNSPEQKDKNTTALAIINPKYNNTKTRDGKENEFHGKFDDVIHEMQIIRSLLLRNDTTNEDQELQDEWRYLAKILDRFFFTLLFFTVVGTSCGLLIPASLYYK